MAKDTTELSNKRDSDSKPTAQVKQENLIIVEGDKSYYVSDKGKRKEISGGKKVRNKAVTRVEVTAGVHVIFEPTSVGPIPEEIFKRPRFQEALGSQLVEV